MDQTGETADDFDQQKVDVAVRFLQNPNVSSTDNDRKINFLKSKGLNDHEIEVAINKAETFIDQEAPSSKWSFFDYAKGIVLGVGILSAANYAYKAYILPYIAHEMKDDRRIEMLKENLQTLNDDLKQSSYELTGTLKQMKTLLEDQQKVLQSIASKQDGNDSNNMGDLKTELATLKSMMLNKRQFPPPPFSPQNGTEIPAWQKAEKIEETTVESNDSEAQES